MSLDATGLLVIPIVLGHVSLIVLFINVTHGLGLANRWIPWIKLIAVAAAIALGGTIIAAAWAGPLPAWPWPLRTYAIASLAAAFVAWPLGTLIRGCRRRPAGITGRSDELDLAAADGKDALIGSGMGSWMLRLPGNESFRLKRVDWEIAIPDLPESWDGLSLVHLTDLHFTRCYQRRFFETVADVAADWDADLIAFTGDLVDHDEVIDWIVPVMSRLRGRLGTFAILGNHDREHKPRLVRRALRDAGFTDLEGRWTRLVIEGATLAVGGTSYPWGRPLDPQAMPAADFRLMLSHTPDRFAWAARSGIDLVLAGHNHAGQIRLPVVGPVFMPSIYSRHFDRGFFRSGRTLMYVGQGIAGEHPLRYGGCLPEITRLVLRVARAERGTRSQPLEIGEPIADRTRLLKTCSPGRGFLDVTA